MFEEAQRKEPEDIFANTESVPTPPAPTAAPAPTLSSPGPAPLAPPASPMAAPAPMKQGGEAWKGILIAVIVVVVIGAAGYISYMLLSSQTPVTPALEEIIEQQELLDETTPEPAPAPVAEPEPEPESVSIDTDKDGLTDAEEAALGTDPNLADTDGDRLFDYEEVNTYQTDPLNMDTDGDGFFDGDEVDNGYNPAGEGELFVVPAAS
ncbi:thrombospondin type 3 repeat-containing protein [Patescibacteria group bacterium]|nr:thrombospondin type 3 repeat-containing protein [Patescibacteria group bacterium]MBU1705115.1 thrombospondin type 3 repeat-containing protein [Patescibacteria group bacterium]